MSQSSLAESGCIEGHASLVDALEEVGVANRSGRHEVDAALEEVCQREEKAEVSVGRVFDAEVFELDEEIEIAAFGVEPSLRRRAEDIEPSHAVLAAEGVDLLTVLSDEGEHGLIISVKALS